MRHHVCLAAEGPGHRRAAKLKTGSAGDRAPIFLVLCGSEVGFFEREVVNHSTTIYSRAQPRGGLGISYPAECAL